MSDVGALGLGRYTPICANQVVQHGLKLSCVGRCAVEGAHHQLCVVMASLHNGFDMLRRKLPSFAKQNALPVASRNDW